MPLPPVRSTPSAKRKDPKGLLTRNNKEKIIYDTTQLTADELHVLATYILPHEHPATDLFEQMLIDLKPFGVKKLKGTIGRLQGRYFENVFLQSPYWQILSARYNKQGTCPLCHQLKSLIITPVYHLHGVNHLHMQEHLLACRECHLTISLSDSRLWKPLKDEEDYEVGQFLDLLREQRHRSHTFGPL